MGDDTREEGPALSPVDAALRESAASSSARWRTLGPLLTRGTDEVLQRVVEEAARETGFPVALVSLMLQRTQFFKAHVGLPAELQASQSTDRCVSFCQFVLESGRGLAIDDTHEHPELPRPLIDSHGLRAYVGAPLVLGGEVVGTLCVLDVRPHPDTDSLIERLQPLALRVERRLAEIALACGRTATTTLAAAEPSFAEIRNQMMSLQMSCALAQMAQHEQRGLLQLLERARQGNLGCDALLSTLEVSADTLKAPGDLAEALSHLQSSLESLQRTVFGLEGLLEIGMDHAGTLSRAMFVAEQTAHHLVKLVGGIRWTASPARLLHEPCPSGAAAVWSAALAELAHQIPGHAAGLRGRVSRSADQLVLTLETGAPDSGACERVQARLQALVPGHVTVSSSAESLTISLRVDD